jgi:hypothetical protein
VRLTATVHGLGDPGTIREFNEDILYLAHSLATTDEVIRPPGAREGDFIRQVDAEIEKVNKWTKRIQTELLAAVRAPAPGGFCLGHGYMCRGDRSARGWPEAALEWVVCDGGAASAAPWRGCVRRVTADRKRVAAMVDA